MIRKLLYLVASVSILFGGQLEALLGALSEADDLSKQTVRESDGHVIVFTRQDLDRMKIKSLKELVEMIPFMRYNENDFGLIDPGYIPFQPYKANFIKLYLDDREITDALGSSGVQTFSEMGLEFVDHVEIYLGAVSFNIGIEPSLAIIKLYSKEPSRENATVVSFSHATYGTKDLYFYQGKELDDYSYFVYLNHRDVNRPKVYFKETPLSRNKRLNMAYGKLKRGAWSADLNIINGGYDIFTGRAISLEPDEAKSYLQSIRAGITYKKGGRKFFINSYYDRVMVHGRSKKIYGALQTNHFPFYYPYKNIYHVVHEWMHDMELSQEFKFDNKWQGIVGVRGRIQRFSFEKSRYGNTQKNLRYKGMDTLTLFGEGKYLFDKNNLAIFSLKKDKIYEQIVKDYIRTSMRIGYVYNSPSFVVKAFGIKTEFVPQPVIFMEMETNGYLEDRLKKEQVSTVAVEGIKKWTNSRLSLLVAYMKYKNNFYRDFQDRKIKNRQHSVPGRGLNIEYTRSFNVFDKISWNYWIYRLRFATGAKSFQGGYVRYYKKFGSFDVYNSLVYRKGHDSLKSGFDYSFALNYHYTKSLNFYIKGINLFKKALKNNYYGYDIASGEILKLKNVNVIDRTLWVGLEYQF